VRRHPRLAERTRHVAVDEWGHYEVARSNASDVGADLLDDADELVTDRPDGMGRFAPVVPEVRTADAAEHDANDRFGRLLDGGAGTIAHGDGTGAVEDRCSHGGFLPSVARRSSRKRLVVSGVAAG
jgi:hypothetical protein